MLIVADASPLISLAIINRLDLLSKLYDDFILPEEVYEEVIKENKPYSKYLQKSLKKHIRPVKDKLATEILKSYVDTGESAAIILALENKIDRILIDDHRGRRAAKQSGLIVVGTLGLLLRAKEIGLISSIKKDIDTLRKGSIRIGENLYLEVLKLAGEL